MLRHSQKGRYSEKIRCKLVLALQKATLPQKPPFWGELSPPGLNVSKKRPVPQMIWEAEVEDVGERGYVWGEGGGRRTSPLDFMLNHLLYLTYYSQIRIDAMKKKPTLTRCLCRLTQRRSVFLEGVFSESVFSKSVFFDSLLGWLEE